MKKLLNFKTLRMKILLAFTVVILIASGYAWYNLNSMMDIRANMEEVQNKDLQLQINNSQAATNFAVQIAAIKGFALSKNNKYTAILEESHEALVKNTEVIKATDSNSSSSDLDNRSEAWYSKIQETVIPEIKAGNMKVAQKNLTALDEESTAIRIGYQELANTNTEKITKNVDELLHITQMTQRTSFALALLIIIASVSIALMTARSISRPIIAVTKRLAAVQKGDLTQPIVNVTDRDEVGQLAQISNDLTISLRSMLGTIQNVSKNVSDSSSHLALSSNEVKQGSEQISVTMQELAEGTEEQASNASDLSSTTEGFISTIRTATKKGNDIYTRSNEVLDLTKEGSSLMQKSTVQMTSIDHIMSDAVKNMQDLNKESEQISTLVQVINSIADQTNLLALNAAIEAARAGEAGKGFAVVAGEVKKLAEQVSTSVTDISGIVQKIQTNTNRVSTSLENGYEEVLKGTEQIQATSETFTIINKSVSSMAQDVQSISDDLHNIEKSSNSIQLAVDEIASVSEESAAGVEETTATIQQTTSSMEQISSNADTLSDMSQELMATVNKFKL